MKQINKQIFFLAYLSIISINFVTAKDSEDSKELVDLKNKLDQAVLKVFLNRPIENWGKAQDIVTPGQENKQAKYSEWVKVIEEVGKFIKDSGSKELPPIYEKYFKPRYFGNQKPFIIDPDTKKPQNDIVTDIISQIGVAFSIKDLKERSEKLKSLESAVKAKISILKDEINNVGKSYFAATAQAKALLKYLADNILQKILDRLSLTEEKEFIIRVNRLTADPKKLAAFSLVMKKELSAYNATFIQYIITLIGIRPIATLTGHNDVVSSVRFSPDGNYAISGARGGTIKIWDVRDKSKPKEIATLTGHHGSVYSVGFSPDGNYVISASGDGTIKIWDVRDKSKPKEIATLENNGVVLSVGFSPDGNYVISGSEDKTIKIWDVKDKSNPKKIATLTGQYGSVFSAGFSPDGNYAISGSYDETIRIWDVKDKSKPKEIATLIGHTEGVGSVGFSPDGNYVISGSGDRTIKIWDVKDKSNPKKIATLTGHNGVVYSVGFSPDGNYVISGSVDRTIKIWDAKDKSNPKEIATLTGHNGVVRSVGFSPDGNYVISGSYDHTIKLWDLRTLTLYDNFFSKLADKKTIIKENEPAEPTGVIQYLLLKTLIDYRKKQEEKSINNIAPFRITYPKLKKIFNDLPDVLKDFFVKNNYVKIG